MEISVEAVNWRSYYRWVDACDFNAATDRWLCHAGWEVPDFAWQSWAAREDSDAEVSN